MTTLWMHLSIWTVAVRAGLSWAVLNSLEA